MYLQYGKHQPTPRAMALVALDLYPPLRGTPPPAARCWGGPPPPPVSRGGGALLLPCSLCGIRWREARRSRGGDARSDDKAGVAG
jgi:hypothetical protein